MKFNTLYILKLWENCEKSWRNLTEPTDKQTVYTKFNKLTKNGTMFASPGKGDYYKVFKIDPNIKIKKVNK